MRVADVTEIGLEIEHAPRVAGTGEHVVEPATPTADALNLLARAATQDRTDTTRQAPVSDDV